MLEGTYTGAQDQPENSMSDKPTDNAFPIPAVIHEHGSAPGMCIRTYVATAALQGLLAGNPHWPYQKETIIECAVRHADELIAQLSK